MQSTWLGSVGLLETHRIYIARLDHTNQPCIHHIHPKKKYASHTTGCTSYLLTIPILPHPSLLSSPWRCTSEGYRGPVETPRAFDQSQDHWTASVHLCLRSHNQFPSWWAESGWNLPFLLKQLISMDPKKCVTWDLGTVIARRRVLCFTRSHLPLISSLHWHSTTSPVHQDTVVKTWQLLSDLLQVRRLTVKGLEALPNHTLPSLTLLGGVWWTPGGREGMAYYQAAWPLDPDTWLFVCYLIQSWVQLNPCEREIAGCSCCNKLEDGFECIYK